MKRTEPQTVRQIIDAVFDRAAISGRYLEERASRLWPDIVGQGINRQTTRRYVREGVLHVYLSSAPLKQELGFQRSAIRDAINEALGQEVLKDIAIH